MFLTEQSVTLSEDQLVEIGKILRQHAPKWDIITQGLHFCYKEIDGIHKQPLLLLEAPVSYLNQMLSDWGDWHRGALVPLWIQL